MRSLTQAPPGVLCSVTPSDAWTVEQVAHWLRQAQTPPNSVQAFVSNHINGKALFLLDEDDLEFDLLVRSQAKRRATLAVIGRARANVTAAADASLFVASAASAASASAAAAASTSRPAVRSAARADAPDGAVPTNGYPGRRAEPGMTAFAQADRPRNAAASATGGVGNKSSKSQALMLACYLSNDGVQVQVERAQAELAAAFSTVVPVSPNQLFLPLAQILYNAPDEAGAQAALELLTLTLALTLILPFTPAPNPNPNSKPTPTPNPPRPRYSARRRRRALCWTSAARVRSRS
jgi:hypothetical protein